jgi:hypothetical protein
VDVFHCEELHAAFGRDLEHAREVCVGQHADEPRLVHEQLRGVGVVSAPAAQHLHGDQAIEAGLARQIDVGHAALGE